MILDIITLVVVGYGFYIGFSRGIIKTVLYIISLFIGFIAAVKFAPSTTDLLTRIFQNSSPFMYWVGFLLCLIVTILLIRMFAKFLESVLKSAQINFINKLAGGVLLGLVVALLFSQVIWLGEQAGVVTKENVKDSISYPYLKTLPEYSRKVGQNLMPIFENFWDQTLEFIDELESKNSGE